jgi:hypothetical protein
MSILTDVLDRLADISALRVQVGEMIFQQREPHGVVLDQQRELAELRGQLKALIQIQSQASKR